MNKEIIMCVCGKELTEFNDHKRELHQKACKTKIKFFQILDDI